MRKIAVALATLAAAAPAIAQTGFTSQHRPPAGQERGLEGPEGRGGPGHGPDRMFEMMDANHDGVVTRAEFDAFHARMRLMHHDDRGPPDGPGGDMPPRH